MTDLDRGRLWGRVGELAQDGEADPIGSYLGRLGTPASRHTARNAIDRLVHFLSGGQSSSDCYAWHELTYPKVALLIQTLRQHYQPATVNKMQAILRGVLKEAWRLGLLPTDQYLRVTDFKLVSVPMRLTGRALSVEELEAVLAICRSEGTPAGARDGALITVLARAGLRRAEAGTLDLSDYDVVTGRLKVEHGKGNKYRDVYIGPKGQIDMARWIGVRGSAPGPLFLRLDSSRQLTGERVSFCYFSRVLERRARQAGVARFTPHDLRRTFATWLLEVTDLLTVQKLMGHARPETTVRYDHRGEEAKRNAVAAIERVSESGS